MLFSFKALFSTLAIHHIANSVLRKENFGECYKTFCLQIFVSYDMKVKKGDGVNIHMHIGTWHLWKFGGMPPRKFLYFKLSQIASGAFSGSYFSMTTS